MDEQGYRFGVGVLVVASMVIAVILILFFGAAPNLFKQQYIVTIRFDAAPHVASDTPVRKSGVRIGRVKSVELLDDGGVDLTLELDSTVKLRAKELPQIAIGSFITNEAVVEFVPPTPESQLARFDGLAGSPADGMLDPNEEQIANAFLADGDYFRGGRVAPDPFDALTDMQSTIETTLSSFKAAGLSIQNAGDEVGALAADMRTLVGGGDGELKRIAQQATQTIENFDRMVRSLDALVTDPNIKSTLETVAQRLPQLVDRAELLMEQTDATMASFEGVGRAAEETVQNISDFTAPLGEHGDKMVTDVMRTVNNFDALLLDLKGATEPMKRVAERINNGQGTIAKLIDDDQLYYTLTRTLENVELLTQRAHPILEDVRVFTDKVSRNPSSVVGLRSAILGRPSSAGLK